MGSPAGSPLGMLFPSAPPSCARARSQISKSLNKFGRLPASSFCWSFGLRCPVASLSLFLSITTGGGNLATLDSSLEEQLVAFVSGGWTSQAFLFIFIAGWF